MTLFERIISLENLFEAWTEFRREKSHKKDVMEFELNLEDHIFKLHEELTNNTYKHGGYEAFFICDPKRRHIHKASVRDRLLHHAVVRVLDPMWDKVFIHDSWSSRKNKGTHRAVKRLQRMGLKESSNHSHTVWILKLDIRKFFDSVDHLILLEIIGKKIHDTRLISLIQDIITSFQPGIPLGNLTSQLFANVFMDKFDQFVKHDLKIPNYIRYADDFILMHSDKQLLVDSLPKIEHFLLDKLHLKIHPEKIVLTTYSSGVDYLGYVCFPNHRVLRTKTKRRMLRRVNTNNLSSYSGILTHCRSKRLRSSLSEIIKER